MSILGKHVKQPLEVESYSIEYADDLVELDAISSAVVLVEPAGLTVLWHLVVGTRVKVMLTGGSVGTKHKVTVTATTEDARVLQDEFFVTIKDY